MKLVSMLDSPRTIQHGVALTNGMSRRSFLTRMSGAFIGLAGGLLLGPRQAHASHWAVWPCYGGPACHGCDLNGRCDPNCPMVYAGCPSGSACWYTCTADGTLYRCCDCKTGPNSFCVVRKAIGSC